MGGFEITGPYASALLMSLGALCVFVWAVLSGAFHDADEASRRFCEREIASDETEPTPNEPSEHSHIDELEDYGGGHVQARHGYLPIWLLVVYAVMFLWGLYYAYHYWGGVGPGRIG